MTNIDRDHQPLPSPEQQPVDPLALPPTEGQGPQIPHSGVGGLEKPHREFRETPLHSAVEQGLITTRTPDTPRTWLEAPQPKKKHTVGKVLAGMTAVAAVAGGAFTLGSRSNDSESSSSIAPAVTAAPSPEASVANPEAPVVITTPVTQPEADPVVAPSNTQTQATSPAVQPTPSTVQQPTTTEARPEQGHNPAYGIVDIAHAVDSDDDYIDVTRPNGDVIHVPVGGSADDINEVGVDALARYAAIMSTRDTNQELLNAFSASTDDHQSILEHRDEVFIKPFEDILLGGREHDFQTVVYDVPGLPARFTEVSAGRIALDTQNGGPVYVAVTTDPEWQGLSSPTSDVSVGGAWATYPLERFEISYRLDDNGEVVVTDYTMDLGRLITSGG